jgi:hypothetical protein
LRETDIGITKGLEDIMSNYQSLGQGLERQKLSESIDLGDFYRNLAMARSSAASKKAGLTDILGLAPAVGSLFI